MAILFAVFGKIKQIFSSYVLTSNSGTSSTGPFVIGTGIYSMPLVYLIILGCVALIGYFCWQSYRQEIHEEKLQQKAAAKDENFSNYNLTWVNKLINWAYMSSAKEIPEAIQRWMEDLNLTLAKNQSPIKILVYGVREGSIPPWIREVGQPKKVVDHIEIPLLLDAQEFGLTVSVQEEDSGKVIASTYTAVVSQFQCWYNVILSHVDGRGFLGKFEADLARPHSVKFNLKLQSDQKISTTVPEVVADIIKSGFLNTPFYLNVSTWGPVIPVTKERKKSVASDKKHKKDNNGNTILPKSPKRRSRKEGAVEGTIAENSSNMNTQRPVQTKPPPVPHPRPEPEDEGLIRKSNTMPSDSPNILSDRLKANQAQGLSGSLNSLIGIKRTPSGRGPAKPIRSREKRIIIKVIKVRGLSSNGPVFCQATLDFPHQKCKTSPTKTGSEVSWPKDTLTFDLSSRSSEVKLLLKKFSKGDQKESTIASAVLHLDKIDCDKPSEISVKLQTVDKADAELTLQLDFNENSVDQKFSSPRRSLDLSAAGDGMSPLGEGKDRHGSAATVSSYSSDNMPKIGAQGTTMRTTTTKKVSPRRKAGQAMPLSHSTPDIKMKPDSQPKSDVAVIEGTVAETALKDLSEKAEIAKKSPKPTTNIKKGKVIITAISKSSMDEDSQRPTVSDQEELQDPAAEKPEKESLKSAADSATSERADQATKPKKTRRKRDRPKSLVSGVKKEDMPGNGEGNEWPKVRRSRSLVLNKGKKKQHKTGSATDLHKHASAKEYASYEDESLVNIPENDLQKNTKKKKSKSISKLFSKLGRKPSIRKSRKGSDIADIEGDQSQQGDESQISIGMTSDPSDDKNSLSVPSPSEIPNSTTGSEADSFVSEMTPAMSETTSLNSSMNDEKGIKRSKSLRKRLFGGKRKTTKN